MKNNIPKSFEYFLKKLMNEILFTSEIFQFTKRACLKSILKKIKGNECKKALNG